MPQQEDLQIPSHIAIIMDGNGRWAKQKKLPRGEGHRQGAVSLKEVLKACMELGVKYLTVYAFSTENWKRPEIEVSFLMSLLSLTIDREIGELDKNGIKLKFLGRISELSKDLIDKIKKAEERTKDNKKFNLNIMLNYGGRAEIADAVKILVDSGEEISEGSISRNLYTALMPDPDLLIRTAGEMRISNFMLWQVAYSELYVTDTLWPDFRKKHLLEAIQSYNKRVRKYGGL